MTNQTDQNSDFADFQRGYNSAVQAVAMLFEAALEAGVDDMDRDVDKAELLAREINKILDSTPANAPKAERAGRIQGTIKVLAGLAWRGFQTLPRGAAGEVH